MIRPASALLAFVAMLGATVSSAQVSRPRESPPGKALPWISTIVIGQDNWSDPDVRFRVTREPEPAIAKFKDRAARDGDVLRLRLQGDRVLKIFDEGICVGYASCLRHRLRDWWPELHYYVVEVRYGENGWAYLIRESDGLVLEIAAPPLLSPDGRYAIASDPSVINGGGDTELLDMRTDPPTVHPVAIGSSTCAAHTGLITLGPDPAWLGNTQVVFNAADVNSKDGMRKARLTLRIIDGKPEWEC
jgi:hypothetical protein